MVAMLRTKLGAILLCVASLETTAASFANTSDVPRHIFFELGINRGQTLNDLLKSTDMDRSLIKPLLKSLMGGGRDFNWGDWCFHGFEANPVFTTQLQNLERKISQMGLCVRLNTQTLAGMEEGNIPFYVDGRVGTLHGPTKKYFAEGSTMDPAAGKKLQNHKIVNVPSIDFAAYLEAHLPSKGALAVLRMDIEGGEYTLLPYLLRPRGGRPPVICELDLLVIEFHRKRMSRQVVDQHLEYRDRLGRECPRLRVALDVSNYNQPPWKQSWPRPVEWKHLSPRDLDPYHEDRIQSGYDSELVME